MIHHAVFSVGDFKNDLIDLIVCWQVPVPFLIMLLLQFVLIIIDRALYLRKQVIGKFLYQILLVGLIHLWMFFILPAITQRLATTILIFSLFSQWPKVIGSFVIKLNDIII